MRFVVLAAVVVLTTDIVMANAPRSSSLRSGERLLSSGFYLCGGNLDNLIVFCVTNRTTCEINITSGDPFCRCIDGYGGDQCQEDVDECVESYPCAGGDKNTSFCVNHFPPEKYKCGCRDGYDAVLPSEITDPVPVSWRPLKCLPNPAPTNPTPKPTPEPTRTPTPSPNACTSDSECGIRLDNAECVGGSCVCKKGFFRTPGLGKCENENECQDDGRNDCHRYATCVDTEGSYLCICNDGFHDFNSTLPPGRDCAQTNECLDPTQNDCEVATHVCLDRRPPKKWECVERTPSPTPAPTPRPTKAPVCFPGDASVVVKDKGQVEMRNLRIGDHVLGSDGKFYLVYAFGHQDFNGSTDYVRLYTNATVSPLEISPAHFLFLHEQQELPVLPESLKKGDIVLGTDNQPFMITKIEYIVSKGIFAPFTTDGTIVVNGIVCSSYAFSFPLANDSSDYLYWGQYKIMTQNEFIHMRFSPLRLAALGVSPWFGKLAEETEGRNYLTFAYHKAYKWMMKSDSPVVQALGFLTWHFFVGMAICCYTVECLVGATRGPAIIVTSLIVLVHFSRQQQVKGKDSKSSIACNQIMKKYN